MHKNMISLFLYGLLPWLLIMLLLQKKILKNRFFSSPGILFFAIGVFVAGMLLLPIRGFSLLVWSASLMGGVSVPLVGLLLVLIMEKFFSCTLFSAWEWRTTWIFGMLSSLILYPAALGLGPIDPYCWGWGNNLFLIVIAILTFFLLVTKNRFAILILLALAAFDFQLQETTNLWDYLIDPIYAVLALVMGMRSLFFNEEPQEPHFQLLFR
ncbi:MAG: hypothetical protein DVB29_05030 [Verrucomicrobia bacterium]|nr:MAG: hypothetical protein DVB29_05030 [Verrucomicrobiota bacterium]